MHTLYEWRHKVSTYTSAFLLAYWTRPRRLAVIVLTLIVYTLCIFLLIKQQSFIAGTFFLCLVYLLLPYVLIERTAMGYKRRYMFLLSWLPIIPRLFFIPQGLDIVALACVHLAITLSLITMIDELTQRVTPRVHRLVKRCVMAATIPLSVMYSCLIVASYETFTITCDDVASWSTSLKQFKRVPGQQHIRPDSIRSASIKDIIGTSEAANSAANKGSGLLGSIDMLQRSVASKVQNDTQMINQSVCQTTIDAINKRYNSDGFKTSAIVLITLLLMSLVKIGSRIVVICNIILSAILFHTGIFTKKETTLTAKRMI